MFAHYNGIVALLLYVFILFPLLSTLIQQFKIISLHRNNGLQNYRKAMFIIVLSHFIDALFVLLILFFVLTQGINVAKWFMIGFPFFVSKSLVAFGAWLYYFIYRGSDMSFLSGSFWKVPDNTHD